MYVNSDLSRLDAFVLGEVEPLASAPESEIPLLLRAAASFGYCEALSLLLTRNPNAGVLGKALINASECGKALAVQILLLVGAKTDHLEVE